MEFIRIIFWIGKEILTKRNIFFISVLVLTLAYFLGAKTHFFITEFETLEIGNSTLAKNSLLNDPIVNLYLFFSLFNLVLFYLLKESIGLIIDKSFLTHTLVRTISRKQFYLANVSFSTILIFISNSALCLIIMVFSFLVNDVYLANFIPSLIYIFPFSLFISIIYTAIVFYSSDKITSFVYLFIYLYVAPGLFQYMEVYFTDRNEIIKNSYFTLNKVLFGTGSLSYNISLFQVEATVNTSIYFYSVLLPMLLFYLTLNKFNKISI